MRSLKSLPREVRLICARRRRRRQLVANSSGEEGGEGPCSPIRGTIVDNVDTGRSEKAFASRVRKKNTSQFRSHLKSLDNYNRTLTGLWLTDANIIFI